MFKGDQGDQGDNSSNNSTVPADQAVQVGSTQPEPAEVHPSYPFLWNHPDAINE